MRSDLMLSFEFIKNHPIDAARILEQLKVEETASFLKQTPPTLAAGVIWLMDSIHAARCLEVMDKNHSGEIITELPLEISSLLFRRIEDEHKQAILDVLSPEASNPLRLILSYPEDTAGALMDPQVFILHEDITVKEGIRRFRKYPRHLIYYVYVVNREHVLVGHINISDLLLSDSNALISSVMQRDMTRLSPNLSCQAILTHLGWQEYHALPVTDNKGIFLGAIGYRTIQRLLREDKKHHPPTPVNKAAKAMRELYWLGLSGMINWAASALSGKEK